MLKLIGKHKRKIFKYSFQLKVLIDNNIFLKIFLNINDNSEQINSHNIINYCIEKNKLNLLKYIYDDVPHLFNYYNMAILNNNLRIFMWLVNRKSKKEKIILDPRTIAKYIDLKFFIYICNEKHIEKIIKENLKNISYYCLIYEKLDLLIYINNKFNYKFYKEFINDAIKYNKYDIVIWIYKNKFIKYYPILSIDYRYPLWNEHSTKLLKWIRKKSEFKFKYYIPFMYCNPKVYEYIMKYYEQLIAQV